MNLFKDITTSKKILIIRVFLAVVATLSFTTGKAQDYPREPDPLRSGKIRWVESQTPDGWTMVTNEDGVTLGYSKSSGLQLIQVDGFVFKDLNRNKLLDQFEDWRVDFETRAKVMVEDIPIEQMMGMKMNPFGMWAVNPDTLDTKIKNSLNLGYR